MGPHTSERTDAPKHQLNKLFLGLKEKQVSHLVRTPEGRQALRNVLGFNFVFPDEVADQPTEKKLPIVAVLMPIYKTPARGVTGAYEELVAASRGTCQVFFPPATSTSVIHWLRNYLQADLIKSGVPFDYVCWWDDDIIPPADSLVRLLKHDVDVVAAGCTVRKDPPVPNFKAWDPVRKTYVTMFSWPKHQTLIEVGAVGTGFFLVSKKVLLDLANYYIKCSFEQKYMGMPAEFAEKLALLRDADCKDTRNFWWFENLKQPNGRGEFGEDISFCFKATECGYKIYVDTKIRPKHIGDYGYSLDDYEQYQSAIIEDQVLVGDRITNEVSALLEEVNF